MQFIHFISAIIVVYVVYYVAAYFLEISKLKKATVNNGGASTIYAVQVEKQQPLTMAGKIETVEAEDVETEEKGDDEKKK